MMMIIRFLSLTHSRHAKERRCPLILLLLLPLDIRTHSFTDHFSVSHSLAVCSALLSLSDTVPLIRQSSLSTAPSPNLLLAIYTLHH